MSSAERILDAASELVMANGAGVSLGEIAKAAGVSRQAVYLHFHSRGQLFFALVRRMDADADIRGRCRQALKAPDPVDALVEFTRTWLDFVVEVHPVATMLLAERHGDAAAWEAWTDRMAELRAGYALAVGRLAGAGLLAVDLGQPEAADLAVALVSVSVWEQLVVDRGWTPAQAQAQMTAALVATLVRAPAADATRSRRGQVAG